MRAAKVQASLRICAVLPEPPLLAHTSSETRGTFRQKARSLAPLNGWACAVKICHDGKLEDTNSLDAAHLLLVKRAKTYLIMKALMATAFVFPMTTLSPLTVSMPPLTVVMTFTPVSMFTMATKSNSLAVRSVTMVKVMVAMTCPVLVQVSVCPFTMVTESPVCVVLPQMMMVTVRVLWVVLCGPTAPMFQRKLRWCWSYYCSHYFVKSKY